MKYEIFFTPLKNNIKNETMLIIHNKKIFLKNNLLLFNKKVIEIILIIITITNKEYDYDTPKTL